MSPTAPVDIHSHACCPATPSLPVLMTSLLTAPFHLCFRKPWSFLTFPSYTLPSKAQTDVIRGQPDVPICRICSCPGNCVLGCTGFLCLSLACKVQPRQTVFSLRPPRATTVHLLFSLHSKHRVTALGKAGPCVINALQVPGEKGLLT